METNIKCAVVGGPFVGKTSCIKSYINGRSELKKFEGNDGLIEYFSTLVKLDNGRETNLQIWDTGRSEGSERARISVYPQTDVIVIMFDLVRRDTMLHVESFWYREISGHCPNAPLILVGTKLDLRDDKRYRKGATTYKEGSSLARRIGARKYIECSSETLYGLNIIFQEAVHAVLDPSDCGGIECQDRVLENNAQKCCCYIS